MKQSNTLVFFGSGPVGKATLAAMIEAGFEIEAVITKARAAHHKGDMPVLDFADTHNLKAFTPSNSDDLAKLFNDSHFTSQMGLVVDYGIIISREIIDNFKYGIVNSHFSLLPEWRGADPITFAILSGQNQTGVSLMLINEKLDEGHLLAQESLNIPPDTTAPELTSQLIELSNGMLIRDLPRYINGEIKPFPQSDERQPTYSRKLEKSDGTMDLGKSAVELEREVRAYLQWPKSRINIYGHPVIVTKARIANNEHDGSLVIKTADGYLELLELKAPSGRTISGADFIRGYRPKI